MLIPVAPGLMLCLGNAAALLGHHAGEAFYLGSGNNAVHARSIKIAIHPLWDVPS